MVLWLLLVLKEVSRYNLWYFEEVAWYFEEVVVVAAGVKDSVDPFMILSPSKVFFGSI